MKNATSNLRVGVFKRAHFIEMSPKKRTLYFADHDNNPKCKEILELSFPYVQFWPGAVSFMTCSFSPLDSDVVLYNLPLPHIIPTSVSSRNFSDACRVCVGYTVPHLELLTQFWTTKFSYGYNVWSNIKETIHKWHKDGELIEDKQTKIDPELLVYNVIRQQPTGFIEEFLRNLKEKRII